VMYRSVSKCMPLIVNEVGRSAIVPADAGPLRACTSHEACHDRD
jgi:hypothetical protein